MANNLKDHLKEVADAIRAKKGTTDLINPQDFAEEIGAISGGSGEGGGSTVEYLNLEGLEIEEYFPSLLMASIYVKGEISNSMGNMEVTGATIGMFSMLGSAIEKANAVCIDFSSIFTQKMGDEVHSISIEDMIISGGSATKEQLDAIPRLTKEQFYSLD